MQALKFNANGRFLIAQFTDIHLRSDHLQHVENLRGLFAAILEMQDVMGVFAGHDHDNNYIGPLHGIALAYGQKSGFGSYGNAPRGARIIELIEGKSGFTSWIRTQQGIDYPYQHRCKQRAPGASAGCGKQFLSQGVKPATVEQMNDGVRQAMVSKYSRMNSKAE